MSDHNIATICLDQHPPSAFVAPSLAVQGDVLQHHTLLCIYEYTILRGCGAAICRRVVEREPPGGRPHHVAIWMWRMATRNNTPHQARCVTWEIALYIYTITNLEQSAPDKNNTSHSLDWRSISIAGIARGALLHLALMGAIRECLCVLMASDTPHAMLWCDSGSCRWAQQLRKTQSNTKSLFVGVVLYTPHTHNTYNFAYTFASIAGVRHTDGKRRAAHNCHKTNHPQSQWTTNSICARTSSMSISLYFRQCVPDWNGCIICIMVLYNLIISFRSHCARSI